MRQRGLVVLTLALPAAAQSPFTEGLSIADATQRFEAIFDVNADGVDDIVGVLPDAEPGFALRLTTLVLDGAGAVAQEVVTQVPDGVLASTDLRSSAVGDLDEDAAPDFVLLLGEQVAWFEAEAGGDFALRAVLSVPVGTTSTAQLGLGQLDGIGGDELVVGSYTGIRTWAYAQGQFQLLDHEPLPDPILQDCLFALADFDGDGKDEMLADLVPASHLEDEVIAHYTLVDGDVVLVSATDVGVPAGRRVVVGDLDGDGDLDGMTSNYYTTPSGHLVWNEAGVLVVDINGSRSGSHLVDVDGDGDLDAVSALEFGPYFRAYVALNDGTGAFADHTIHPMADAHRLAGATDFDGDGDLDLVAGRDLLLNTTRVGAPECTAIPNSTGLPATLVASGTASVSANDLVITTRNMPPGQAAMTFFGYDAIDLPLGDGRLCVGGPHARLGVTIVQGDGKIVVPVDLTRPPASAIEPGDLRRFQTWFRDPAAGGAGSNLSQAGRILFLP